MQPKPTFLRRRQALQLIAGFSSALLLHACGQSSSSTESQANGLTSISIGSTPWVGLSPLYIAQEKGFFAEEGVEVDLNIFSSNGDSLAAFTSGQLTALGAVSSEVVLIASQGKDFKVVMVEDNSVGADGILARDSVSSVADFKGKDVAVDTSGVSYFFLLQVLEEAGLSKDDIKSVNIDPAGAATAYQSGNVDIAVTYAPFLQQANEEVPEGRIIYDSAKMPTAIIDMFLFDSDLIASNPEAVQGFVNGIFKGLKFLTENEEEGLAIAAKAQEIEPDALASDLAGVKLPDPATNQQMLSQSDSDLYIMPSLQALAEFLVDQGELDAVPESLAEIIDPQFVEAAQS